jgi:prepilin-type N-terminal cleavage/methylation domain-containing protein/prepilin-type processing-associated H-X9-DG protein
MNTQHPKPRKKCNGAPSGFTLIELLAVLGAIGLLLALLMPLLARAKSSAVRVSCLNNLHQIGLCLRAYIDDYARYPAFQTEIRAATRDGFWDAKLALQSAGSSNIFLCPANTAQGNTTDKNWSPTPPDSVVDPLFASWPNLSYGYNGTGNAAEPFPVELEDGVFLGFGGENFAEGGSGFWPTYLSEARIVSPVDMITLADYDPWATDEDRDNDRHPEMLFLGIAGRHSRGANVLLCDNHVEFGSTNYWTRTSAANRRWNSDHRPHTNRKEPIP